MTIAPIAGGNHTQRHANGSGALNNGTLNNGAMSNSAMSGVLRCGYRCHRYFIYPYY